MIYFTAHTFKCVCHCRRAMFRVLGMYNFGSLSIPSENDSIYCPMYLDLHFMIKKTLKSSIDT